MVNFIDEGADAPHDIAAVSDTLPTFYPAAALQDMTARLDVFVAGDGYLLPSGVEPDVAAPVVTAQAVFAHVIAVALQTLTTGDLGYHTVDVTALEAALPVARDGDSGVVDAWARVGLLLQATYANAGDNDLARGIAGAEHLLLDLETLFARAG